MNLLSARELEGERWALYGARTLEELSGIVCGGDGIVRRSVTCAVVYSRNLDRISVVRDDERACRGMKGGGRCEIGEGAADDVDGMPMFKIGNQET